MRAKIVSGGTTTPIAFTYDPRGNLTSDGQLLYNYDYENRMVSVSQAGGAAVAAYDYDPAGRRTIKDLAGGARTGFVHAGDMEIADVDLGSHAVLRRYIPGAGVDQWAAFVDEVNGGAVKYVHQDRQGSVFALSDAGGNIQSTDKFVYDPYGLSPSSSAGFPFRYTGQRLDPETGLYYYRARYYNPTLARFMQTDPIGVQGGLDLYAYVSGDPLGAVDPTGTHCDQTDSGEGGAKSEYNCFVDGTAPGQTEKQLEKANNAKIGLEKVYKDVVNALMKNPSKPITVTVKGMSFTTTAGEMGKMLIGARVLADGRRDPFADAKDPSDPGAAARTSGGRGTFYNPNAPGPTITVYRAGLAAPDSFWRIMFAHESLHLVPEEHDLAPLMTTDSWEKDHQAGYDKAARCAISPSPFC